MKYIFVIIGLILYSVELCAQENTSDTSAKTVVRGGIFGWVVFPSKEIRDQANQAVPQDPRMSELVAPLVDPKRMIFNAERMVYGGFEELIQS